MIDEIDKIIISSLMKDGRVTLTKLAKKVNISVTAIKNRVNTLIMHKKIISGFRACINFERLNYITAFVAIEVTPKRRQDVIKALSELPNVLEIYEITGPHDLIIKLVVENISEMRDLLSVTMSNITGIKKTYTMIVIRKTDLIPKHIDALLWRGEYETET